jgi:hypothetical protein
MEYLATDTTAADERPEEASDTARKDPLTASAEKARKWQTELDASKRWMEKFCAQARRCEAAYMGSATNGDSSGSDPLNRDQRGKVNLFWSNVQVILSAIYGRLPQAEVDRKFGDFTDDVSRVAGIIMQRILNGDIEREHDDTNAAMRDAVQDRFIVGLGQVWCRYEVETEEVDQPVRNPLTGQPMIDPTTGQPITTKTEKIINEEAPVDYVHWEDFRYSPCRRWREARWVARRVYMNEKQLRKRFKLTPVQLGMIPMRASAMDASDRSESTSVLRATPFKQAGVWELWDKEENYVCWYVEGCSFILDEVQDPLQLDDFFPCPQPVVATTLTNAFRPRADYSMAQDLYRELDRINARIASITRAVKVAGVYDKTAGPLKSLLTTAVENALVPADNWSTFVEKGGMKGVIDWMPIEQYVNALMQLVQRKGQIERDLYEVLGISDIMRGTSAPSETLGAQQLKAQYGGARLGNLQNEVARFVSATMRIRANIISNHFQPETLIKRSLIERTPDAQLAQPAVQLLKDFGTALYSITVTADTLAAPDWAAEKEARTEFMGATSNYLMAAGPMVQQSPEIGAFLLKLLQWGAAGFKGSKTIEGVLDQAARALEQQAQQPKPPAPPTPEDRKDDAAAVKSQADAERSKAEAQRTTIETAILARGTGMPYPMPGQLGAPPQGMQPPQMPQPPQLPPQPQAPQMPQVPGNPMGGA